MQNQNIAIVGDGPTGWYAASRIAQELNPQSITLFKKERSDEGLGYSIHRGLKDTIQKVNPEEALDDFLLSPPRQKEFYTRNHSRTVTSRHELYTIQRTELIAFLERAAAKERVRVGEHEVNDIREITSKYDLVLAADGKNSMALSYFPGGTIEGTLESPNEYNWFPLVGSFDKMKAAYLGVGADILQLIAYPKKGGGGTAVVRRNPTQAVYFGDDDVRYLNAVFGEMLGEAEFVEGDHTWNQWQANILSRMCYENVVLIGEATGGVHFGTGAGLSIALQTVDNLIKLHKSSLTPIKDYNRIFTQESKRVHAFSQEAVLDFEKTLFASYHRNEKLFLQGLAD